MQVKNVLIDDSGFIMPLAVTFDAGHLMVHEGYAHAFYAESLDLDINANMDVLVEVGAKPLHVVLALEALGGLLRGRIYRSPTTSAKGTLMGTPNFNDLEGRDKPLLTKVYLGPTVTDAGTLILPPAGRLVLAAGQGASRVNSAVRAEFERVLRPNTTYLLRQTALADNVVVTLAGAMYEEDV